MKAVLALFALRIRLLTNRLKIGSRAGRIGMGFLRACSYILVFAFLRFGALILADTGANAGNRFGLPAQVFFFQATALMTFAIIFVVNLLVFAAEEFDITDSTRDTAFLLSLPLTLRQVVWAKSLLRSTVDVYGVFLLVPLIWALVKCSGCGGVGILLAVPIFFSIELAAILLAMALFIWTARLVPYHRLEAVRLALGLVLPGLASVAITLLRASVDSGMLVHWTARYASVVSKTPPALLIGSVFAYGRGEWAASLSQGMLGFLSLGAMLLLCDLVIALPQHALAKMSEGMGRTGTTTTGRAFLSFVRSPLAILLAKDLILLSRRPVFLLTTVFFPIGITIIDLVTIAHSGHLGHADPQVEYLSYASVYVTLIILPFLGAAQSFGQTEHGRIPLLQTLPLKMERVMYAKVLLFTPLVVGSCWLIQVAGDYTFGVLSLEHTLPKLFWTSIASVLATHVAVAAASLFPIFEFGVLAVRGANMAIGGMLHVSVTAALGLVLFPLYWYNKLIALSILVPLVAYLWRKGSERLRFYDEGTTLFEDKKLRWDEAYIIFGLYSSLQVIIYIALLFVVDFSQSKVVTWSMDFASVSLVLLGGASLYYLLGKGLTPGSALGLTRAHARTGFLIGGISGIALLVGLKLLAGRIGGGMASPFARILEQAPNFHLVGTIGLMAVVLGPLAEEIFFRGILYQAGARTFSPLFGALASSLLFAILHLDRTIPLMFVMGSFQVVLFRMTGTILAPVIAHAVLNGTGLILFALHTPLAGISRGAFVLYVCFLGGVLLFALTRLMGKAAPRAA
jgi:membrane protease YdiL (CAAX protease family)